MNEPLAERIRPKVLEEYISQQHLVGKNGVLTNLVKNADQASENSSNKIIEVKVMSEGNNIKIIVSDNGKGISEEVKDLIFEPKFTTKSSGMGLGLPMIKNIIEAYDGSISFTSKEGIGTVFSVILPKT